MFGEVDDSIVNPGVDIKLAEFYTDLGVEVTTVFEVEAEHSWITNSYGGACDAISYPFINNCNLDAAGQILGTIYGEGLNRADMITANLYQFNQTEIAPDAGLADIGYIYWPKACDTIECKVHICYHGCMMPSSVIGDKLAVHSGLNEWAEGSGIIVIYPQAAVDLSVNPEGCFDWFGYTGEDYLLKSGKQMAFSYDIVQTLPKRIVMKEEDILMDK